MDTPDQNYLEATHKLLTYYRTLGDKALAQVEEAHLHHQITPESNSIAMIVRHLSGNMLSRFTDFLTTDGEKPWRNREAEFEPDNTTKAEVLAQWSAGWDCMFQAIQPLTADDLMRPVYIRNEAHTVLEAILRQTAHYPYHVGQLVFCCRAMAGDQWQSLSIPKGGSAAYNAAKFEQDKTRAFFTDKV